MAGAVEIRNVRGPAMETSDEGRFYVWHGERYRSVTTMISGGLPKPALIGWGIKLTAAAAVREYEWLGQIIAHQGPDEAARWLRGAPHRDRDRKAKLGSRVHEAAEAYVLEAPYPEWDAEAAPYLRGFLRWLEDFRPRFLAVEAPVFSHSQRYAGTLDAIVEIDAPTLARSKGLPVDRPVRLLIDYKTGGVYPEVALQLAAYRYGESYVRLPTSDEEPLPDVDLCAAVLLQPDAYEFRPVVADEDIFRRFLYVREVYRFVDAIAPGVVGRQIVAEGAA